MANEHSTDARNFPVNWEKQRDPNFKRPDHPDFMSASELKKMEFSGVRRNSLSKHWEIWLVGELKAFGDEKDVNAFAAAYEEIFALQNVEIVEIQNSPLTK